MPLYEFACDACGAQTSLFIRSISAEVNPTCQRCGSTSLRRLISSFAVIGAGTSIGHLEAELAGLDGSDPRAMADWARRMQRQTGEDMGPEFDEMVGRLEHGESGESLGHDDFGGDGLDGDL